MQLAQWIVQFRALHDKDKRDALSAEERSIYTAAREELARALLAAQRVQTLPGQSFRQALRVSRALQATLEVGGEILRAMTVDVSSGGFGALLAVAPPAGEKLKFTLRLPGGSDPLAGTVRVVGVVPRPGNARVAFSFDALADADRARLETLVFDTVLDQLKPDAGKPAAKA
jgi:hypothetical protein